MVVSIGLAQGCYSETHGCHKVAHMVVSIGLAQGCYSETHNCHKVVTSKLQPCLKLVVVEGCL